MYRRDAVRVAFSAANFPKKLAYVINVRSEG